MNRFFYSILLVCLIFTSCEDGAYHLIPDTIKPLNSNIQQPIILIGGLMSSPSTWAREGDGGLAKHLTTNSLAHGGTLVIGDNKQLKHLNKTGGKADFFVTAFYDSTRSVDSLTVELEQFIDYVLDYTNAGKVTLIGHSMGGVVARNYAVKHLNDHHVETIISVSSPHGGSYWANLLYGSELLLGNTKEQVLKTIEYHSGGQLKLLAVSDLIDSGQESFLAKLNRQAHPQDINYFSIVANSSLLGIADAVLPDNIKKRLPGNTNGDWVVSLDNQNMTNQIEYFKQEDQKPRVLASYTIDGANHFSVKHEYGELEFIIESFIDRIN